MSSDGADRINVLSYSSAIAWAADGSAAFINGISAIHRIDASTGKETHRLEGRYGRSPLVTTKSGLLTFVNGRYTLLNPQDLTPIWQIDEPIPQE